MFEVLTIVAMISVMIVTVSLWAFSDFIMRGLGKASKLAAVQAMQGINETVLRSVFIVLFMGSNVLLLALAILAFIAGEDVVLSVAALGLYFFGMFMITGTRNVPLNERLRKTQVHTESDAETAWSWYVQPWTTWNTVRCVFGFAVVAVLGAMLYA